MDKFPKLTAKEQKCLLRYFENGNNKTEAYKYAFECSKSAKNTIQVNASKLFKSTKFTLWLDYYRQNQQKAIDEQFKYTQADAFRELIDLQNRASQSQKTYNIESKCIENKCRLAGLFEKDTPDTNVNVGISVPTIKVNGKDVEFIVGE